MRLLLYYALHAILIAAVGPLICAAAIGFVLGILGFPSSRDSVVMVYTILLVTITFTYVVTPISARNILRNIAGSPQTTFIAISSFIFLFVQLLVWFRSDFAYLTALATCVNVAVFSYLTFKFARDTVRWP